MYEKAVAVLEPLIGLPLAVMCLRAAARNIGKTAEDLERSDIDRLEGHIRKSLSGITTHDMLDLAVSRMRGVVE